METKPDTKTTSSEQEDTIKSKSEANHSAATDIDDDDIDNDPARQSSSGLKVIDKQDLSLEKCVDNDESDDIPLPSYFRKHKAKSESFIDAEEGVMKQDFHHNKFVPCSSCEFEDPSIIIKTTCCFGSCVKHKSIKKFKKFWIISVPKTDDTWRNLNFATKKDGLSCNFKFHIPILKIGTLNILMSLTEQLSTLDKFARDTTEKIVDYMKTVVKAKSRMLQENLKIKGLDPATYLTRFSWNTAKYPVWHSTPLIADIIFNHVDRIQESLRQKVTLFDNLKSNLKSYEKRETESLRYRYLGDIVKKEHFVTGSEFLQTLLVVVPNNQIKIWLRTYETLCDMIVPCSSERIFWDETDSLFSVTLHKKNIEVFKNKAREHQFIVRDFQYSEENVQTENEYYENLSRLKMTHMAAIFQWAKLNFGECFEAWIHAIALRVYVESVLRFGLPINYEAMILIPLRSKTKLRNLLNDMYSDVDNSLATGYLEEIPHALATYGVEEFFPYVFFEINIDFIHIKK